METLSVKTNRRNEMIDVTGQVARAVTNSGVRDGVATVFVPHTTAAVTINENADPDVVHDILMTLDDMLPQHRHGYRHMEGNSDAHVKSSLLGCWQTLIVAQGQLCLGTWQGIYFCEFDGPRSRRLMVAVAGK